MNPCNALSEDSKILVEVIFAPFRPLRHANKEILDRKGDIMLILSVALMIVAAALLFAESMVPDFGVMGVTGLIIFAVAAILTLLHVPFGFLVLLLETGILGGGAFMMFKRAKRRQTGNQIILRETLNEDKPDHENLEHFVGKTGMSKTSLRPVGKAEIGGITLEVLSDVKYIAENTKITVIGVSNNTLVVKEAEDILTN